MTLDRGPVGGQDVGYAWVVAIDANGTMDLMMTGPQGFGPNLHIRMPIGENGPVWLGQVLFIPEVTAVRQRLQAAISR